MMTGDYDHDIERMRREQEELIKRHFIEEGRQRLVNPAKNYISSSIAQDPYSWGTEGPTPRERSLFNAIADTNHLVKQLVNRQENTDRKIERLAGFYHWVTEVHPEMAAQYKAMRDLYEAANPNGTDIGAMP